MAKVNIDCKIIILLEVCALKDRVANPLCKSNAFICLLVETNGTVEDHKKFKITEKTSRVTIEVEFLYQVPSLRVFLRTSLVPDICDLLTFVEMHLP